MSKKNGITCGPWNLFRTSFYALISLGVLLLLVWSLCWVGLVAAKRISKGYADSIAVWQTHDAVIEFAAKNDGRVPTRWDELTSTVELMFGSDDIAFLEQRVKLNSGDHKSTFIIELRQGDSPTLIRDVNESLFFKLNRIREKLPKNDSSQSGVVRRRANRA
jgi:hypothetical protein